MNENSIHLIVDIYTKSDILNNCKQLINFLKKCVKISKNKIIKISTHKFAPQGFSAVALLKESHMTLHTFPEKNYIALDMYSCGNGNPMLCCSYIISKLEPYYQKIIRLDRGNYSNEIILKNKYIPKFKVNK